MKGATTFRHPELDSGSMPHSMSKTGCCQTDSAIEAWMLKQVQHDGWEGSL